MTAAHGLQCGTGAAGELTAKHGWGGSAAAQSVARIVQSPFMFWIASFIILLQ